jgi:carbon storage regulator
MLVLARKINESIVIGDSIHVSVIDIKGDQVKLGIDAPKQVKVYRQEVYDAIQEENRKAARSAALRSPGTPLPSLPSADRGQGKVDR